MQNVVCRLLVGMSTSLVYACVYERWGAGRVLALTYPGGVFQNAIPLVGRNVYFSGVCMYV